MAEGDEEVEERGGRDRASMPTTRTTRRCDISHRATVSRLSGPRRRGWIEPRDLAACGSQDELSPSPPVSGGYPLAFRTCASAAVRF
jgi:hypothetical protein